jgi:outer membrane protein TolC
MKIGKIKSNLIPLFVILLLASSTSLFSEKKQINLEDAVNIAIKNNYNLQTARFNLQKAEARKNEALGSALPSLSISANYMNNIIKPKFFMPNFMNPQSKELVPIEIGQTNSFQTTAQITQIIFNSAVFTGIGTAKIFLDASKEQLKSQMMQTLTDVKRTFFGVILARELVRVMETTQANALKNLEVVESLYKEGFIPEYDLIRARVGVQNLEPEVMNAKNNYTNLLNLLKLNIGLGMQEDIEVVGLIELPELVNTNTDSLYSVIKNSNYNLKSLELATKVNEELVNIYQSEYYPTIALFGNYAFQGQANDFNFQIVKSSAVGVSFSLNLFQGFQSQNRVQQARIDYLSTKEKYTQLLETYKMAINNAIFKMQVAQEKVKTLKANVDQAKRGFDIAQIRYKEGVGNQVEINDANTAFSQANLSYFKALYDLIDSQIEIDNILGNLPNKYLNEIKN